ncbi:MAG TPA: hypothetical protein VGD92_11605 [Sphingobacteriaceae bacterium]
MRATPQHYILLMTACIRPSETNIHRHAIWRNDPEVRLNDYKTALEFWLRYPDQRISGIVFVENSGYDLGDLKDLVRRRNPFGRQTEFLQIAATAIPEGLHYGYSEAEMIDHAFTDSRLVAACSHVVKVTGRIFFPDLSRLLNRVRDHHLIVTDCRDFRLFHIRRQMILTTLFIVRKDFYLDSLYDAKQMMISTRTGLIEWMYYRILRPLHRARPRDMVLRFPFNVEPVGFGAHWNIDYGSRKKKLIATARGISRLLFPALWI